MRNRVLHQSLREFAEQASFQLEADANKPTPDQEDQFSAYRTLLALKLAHKDFRLASDLAGQHGVPTQLLAVGPYDRRARARPINLTTAGLHILARPTR
jgi:3-hydroxyisobutyrate dehydrogenase-like beta-hydroxyacid dehydrogenase